MGLQVEVVRFTTWVVLMLYTSRVIIINDSELFGKLEVKKFLELDRKIFATFVVMEALIIPFFSVGNSESDKRR